MRTAGLLVTLSLSIAALAGCGSPNYGDAGADAVPVQQQNFDVDNSGTSQCPGEIYNVASFNQAVCSQPPERCFSGPADAGNRIVCNCVGADGSTQGHWTCQSE